MMINKLKKATDFIGISEKVSSEYLKEVTAKSPEYLLDIIAQIIEILLARLNVPQNEVETFTEQIKERKMGELFAHFEGYDVQATRKEEREKTQKEEREEAIKKLIKIMKKHGCSKEEMIEDLKEQYDLDEETAAKKVELNWQNN